MNQINKKIAVAVLGYNNQKYLEALFRSLVAQDWDGADYYYIDNASSDDSVTIAQQFAPRVTIVENTENSGYAGAYGQFLENAFDRDGYDGVVLLNPDVVVDESWLSQLVSVGYADNSSGIVQSLILQLNEDGKRTEQISSVGGMLHYLGFGILKRRPDHQSEHERQTDFGVGTSMLIKKEVYDACGGLDHDFFMYLEDMDLSWRTRICGYTCALAQSSLVWHHYIFDRIDDKKRRKFYYLEKNRLSCLWKNYSYKTLILLFPALVAVEIAIFAHALLNGYFFDKARADLAFLRSLPTLHKKHRHIQKMRSVSDREIFDTMVVRVRFDELEGSSLKIANVFFVGYYKIVRFLI